MPSIAKNLSDEELARQVQAGSLEAFEQLVYRYEHRIYGFVVNVCRNGTDAREVTQDTLVRAFQAIQQFDARQKFAPWLFTIARRKCVDLHRRRLPWRAEPVPEQAEQADADDPARLMADREESKNLWELARRALPANQFQALWFRYAEEMDVAEVAQVLRKTRTHIKVLLFRGRRMLARELQRRGAGRGNRAVARSAQRRAVGTAGLSFDAVRL